MAPNRLKWWSSPRRWIRAILMLDDTPHSIALGSAIGMFIAMTPTVGIQMILVGLMALATHKLFHFNRVAALIMVYVSNPLTVVPIYWLNYKVGTLWFPAHVTREEFEALLDYQSFSEWVETITALFIHIGLPLIIGSLVVATICAPPTYAVMYWMVQRFKSPVVFGPHKPNLASGQPAADLASSMASPSGKEAESPRDQA